MGNQIAATACSTTCSGLAAGHVCGDDSSKTTGFEDYHQITTDEYDMVFPRQMQEMDIVKTAGTDEALITVMRTAMQQAQVAQIAAQVATNHANGEAPREVPPLRLDLLSESKARGILPRPVSGVSERTGGSIADESDPMEMLSDSTVSDIRTSLVALERTPMAAVLGSSHLFKPAKKCGAAALVPPLPLELISQNRAQEDLHQYYCTEDSADESVGLTPSEPTPQAVVPIIFGSSKPVEEAAAKDSAALTAQTLLQSLSQANNGQRKIMSIDHHKFAAGRREEAGMPNSKSDDFHDCRNSEAMVAVDNVGESSV